MLERNVQELQGQLAEANKRIIQLNVELDFYKSVHTK